MGSGAVEGFEAAGEVAGVEEAIEAAAEAAAAVVAAAFDGGFLDGAVDAFDPAVGPGVVGAGEALLDAKPGADPGEAARAVPCLPPLIPCLRLGGGSGSTMKWCSCAPGR